MPLQTFLPTKERENFHIKLTLWFTEQTRLFSKKCFITDVAKGQRKHSFVGPCPQWDTIQHCPLASTFTLLHYQSQTRESGTPQAFSFVFSLPGAAK